MTRVADARSAVGSAAPHAGSRQAALAYPSNRISHAARIGEPGAVIRYGDDGLEMVNLRWGFEPHDPAGRPDRASAAIDRKARRLIECTTSSPATVIPCDVRSTLTEGGNKKPKRLRRSTLADILEWARHFGKFPSNGWMRAKARTGSWGRPISFCSRKAATLINGGRWGVGCFIPIPY